MVALPSWLTDLLVRGFSEDYMVSAAGFSRETFRRASDVASVYHLPVGWFLVPGVPATFDTAQRIVAELVKRGPPADCRPATMARHRQAVLQAVCAAAG